MTADREQTRRDAEACLNDNRPWSGFELAELLERMRDVYDALLAELEQAERERDECAARMIDLVAECEARLAKVRTLRWLRHER